MSGQQEDIAAAKVAMRQAASARRDQLDRCASAQAGQAIVPFAGEIAALKPDAPVLSSYRALGSEIDPSPLESELRRLGLTTALPVITRLGEPLVFREWQTGDELVPRKWGILEPADSASALQPDILLLPMLAFDAAGWRLGYGGGFYDRTLAALRSVKSIFAIGMAFSAQEVDAVPHDAYDQRLDFVLTPEGLRSLL